jgi:hypothetical protein
MACAMTRLAHYRRSRSFWNVYRRRQGHLGRYRRGTGQAGRYREGRAGIQRRRLAPVRGAAALRIKRLPEGLPFKTVPRPFSHRRSDQSSTATWDRRNRRLHRLVRPLELTRPRPSPCSVSPKGRDLIVRLMPMRCFERPGRYWSRGGEASGRGLARRDAHQLAVTPIARPRLRPQM